MGETYVGMLFTYKLEKGIHVWPTEMIYGFQTGEHTPVRDALEVILANILQCVNQ